jgi:RNA recognition motif-containing protein
MNIFVASLDYGVKAHQLQELFEQYGPVSSCKVITDRETGRSKGFGFVEMAHRADGIRAIKELNESSFGGRTIYVKEAEDRRR